MKKYDADILWNRIKANKLDQKIIKLCSEENHSYGMILDWLKRDYMHLFDELIITKKSLSRALKANEVYFDLQAYNTSSNFWKLQYRADKAQIKKWAQQGQNKTINIRKKHKSGWKNSKQSIEHYIQNGLSKKDAIKQKNKFVKSNSPFCEEFYVLRGWAYEDAHEKLTNDRVDAALKSLKKTQKPKTEQKIKNILEKENILYSPQYSIKNDIGLDKRKRLVFDFYLPVQNKLLEANGTFWHADPKYFRKGEKISFPGKRTFSVEEIWNRDKRKRECAINQGYRVITLWERELNILSDKEILEKINE